MDYRTRQETYDAEYTSSYAEWVESLSEEHADEVRSIDPSLLDSHIEKPSYSPDYSFMNNIEEDSSQRDFISGAIFDESDSYDEDELPDERILLRESIVSMVLNLESADDTGFAIGVACVALGVRDADDRTIENTVAAEYECSVSTVLEMAALFLEDTNLSSVSDFAALRGLISQLAQTGNPALSLDVLKIATRIASGGESQSEVARRHGVSRQAVHKRRKRLIGALGLRG